MPPNRTLIIWVLLKNHLCSKFPKIFISPLPWTGLIGPKNQPIMNINVPFSEQSHIPWAWIQLVHWVEDFPALINLSGPHGPHGYMCIGSTQTLITLNKSRGIAIRRTRIINLRKIIEILTMHNKCTITINNT